MILGLTCEPCQKSQKRSEWIHELVARLGGSVIVGPNYRRANWKYRGFPVSADKVITAGEICCNMTHQLAYRLIVMTGEPAIILEDDVDFIKGKGPEDLESLKVPEDADVAKLSRPLLLPDHDEEIVIEDFGDWRLQEKGTWGTEALYITPNGAKKLLDKNTPIKYAADTVVKYSPNSHGVKLYQMNDPIFVAGKFDSFIEVNTELMRQIQEIS